MPAMRGFFLLLLSSGLFCACGTQPTATQVPASGIAAIRLADTVQLPKDSSVRHARPIASEIMTPPPPPDSIMAFLGGRDMKFTLISDADLRSLLFNNGLPEELILGRFRLINERYKQLRLYYQPSPGTGDWLETRLEPMDNGFANDCEIKLVSGTLGSTDAPVLLATMEWKTSDRGGKSTRRVVNLIDITGEPRLLLRAETFAGLISFDHDTEADPTETSCEQTVALRNHEIVVGETRSMGDGSCVAVLPSGCYRYQNGKLLPVKE